MTRYNFDQRLHGHELETNRWKTLVWLFSIRNKLQRQDFVKKGNGRLGFHTGCLRLDQKSVYVEFATKKKLYHEGVPSGYFSVAIQVKFHHSLIFLFNSRITPCAGSTTSTRQHLSTPDQPRCYELRKQTQMPAIQLLNSKTNMISPRVLLFIH
jgi:hypothetical protein